MNRTIILMLILVGLIPCMGQGSYAGVYSNADDIIANRFAFKFNCDSGKVRVTLGKTFTLHQKKASRSFNYQSVYGYRDCNLRTFRILNRAEYEIINTEEIILYKTESIVSKSSETEKHYFFSLTLGSALFPLTIQNLNASHAESHPIHDLLDEHFKSDEELMRYNKSIGKYEIVHLLMDARKK